VPGPSSITGSVPFGSTWLAIFFASAGPDGAMAPVIRGRSASDFRKRIWSFMGKRS
jgi:H2-forming N5,N10-methylenetetrahydromethanopterin dehydrogenase-like enzyme